MSPLPLVTPWGGRIVRLKSTVSTMDDARVLEDQGEPDGTLVRADYQSAGRGHSAGRQWKAEPGASLLFTIFWSAQRFRVPSFAPSLTVGLGLCLWLEALGIRDLPIRLKWPNDLYLGDKKVAGILVTRRWSTESAGSLHAGIGINLKPPQGESEFRTPAASLADSGIHLDPDQALSTLLPALALALEEPDPRSACEKRLWRLGQSLDITTAEGTRNGVVRGLGEQGSLLLDGPEGRHSVISGE